MRVEVAAGGVGRVKENGTRSVAAASRANHGRLQDALPVAARDPHAGQPVREDTKVCLQGTLPGINGVKRPGIVHRLDKDTSGVMVAAKTEQAHNHLAAQFADHGRTGPLHRAYLAYCWGRTQQASGTVEAPLGRDPANRLKQAVRKDGREAITHYFVEARFGDEGWDITRVQCHLETGRTHQIRVHMAHIGHPLVADMVYGPGFATKVNRLPDAAKAAVAALGRQALHAAELGFEHPVTGEEMQFEAPLPPDLVALEAAIEPFDRAFAR